MSPAERRSALWDTLRRETRQAVRGLTRSRAFAPVAVGTLALGLGATIAIFTVLDAVVLRPLPYPDAERLVFVSHRAPGLGSERPWGVSVAGYFEYADQVRALEDAGVYTTSRFNLDRKDGGVAERVQGATVSASVFSTLGLRAVQGRLFTPEEDVRGGPKVVVVGYDLWQRGFGGDPSLVGRTIDVHGVPSQEGWGPYSGSPWHCFAGTVSVPHLSAFEAHFPFWQVSGTGARSRSSPGSQS